MFLGATKNYSSIESKKEGERKRVEVRERKREGRLEERGCGRRERGEGERRRSFKWTSLFVVHRKKRVVREEREGERVIGWGKEI